MFNLKLWIHILLVFLTGGLWLIVLLVMALLNVSKK
jgi:hypothetical protein